MLLKLSMKRTISYGIQDRRRRSIEGGDEVAVALVHIIGSSSVTDEEIKRICNLLDEAFTVPDIIVNPLNRHPDVSLLLLDSSRLRTNNPAVRAKISALQSHLISLYKNGG